MDWWVLMSGIDGMSFLPGMSSSMREDGKSLPLVEEILSILGEYGVKFAMEVHPTEITYNIETVRRAIKELDGRKEFGFNFDPSHPIRWPAPRGNYGAFYV